MKSMEYRNLLALAAALAACTTLHAREVEVSQKGKTFMQDKTPVKVLKLKTGDSVSFRNDDPFFHNVFSASPAKSFDLGSYPQGQTRKVTFEKEGAVEVECAIHPDMKLKVEVAK
jgi:plastocyanin